MRRIAPVLVGMGDTKSLDKWGQEDEPSLEDSMDWSANWEDFWMMGERSCPRKRPLYMYVAVMKAT